MVFRRRRAIADHVPTGAVGGDDLRALAARCDVLADAARSAADAQQRHDADVRALRHQVDELSLRLHAVQAEHAAAVAALAAASAEHAASVRDELEARLVDARRRDRAERDEDLSALRREHTEALERVAGDQRQDVDDLRAEHTAAVASAHREHAYVIEEMKALQAAQTAALDIARVEQAAALEEALDSVRASVLADAEAHRRAVAALRHEAEERWRDQRHADAALERRVRDLDDAHTTGMRRLDAHRDALDGHVARIDAAWTAAVAHAEVRLDRHEERLESVADAAARVGRLSTQVDALADRVGAAELQLHQRDDTDLELHLDRIEAFERLAAESDPDRFASSAEVEALRDELRSVAARLDGGRHGM